VSGPELDLSIVIVAWRSLTDLPGCLAALPAAAAGLQYELVVVDNASDDGTVAWLRASHPHVRLLENDENVGFARAVNRGAAQARGRHLVLLNPDAAPAPGSLAALVARLDGDPSLGLAAPRLTDLAGAPLRSAWPTPGLASAAFEAFLLHEVFPRSRWVEAHPDAQGAVACVPGTCLAVRSDCFRALGGLDERFFLYHEDFDFCLRAREAGWGIALVEDARAVHRVGGSAFQDRRTFVLRFEESRRQLIEKYHPGTRGRALRALQRIGLGLRILGGGARGALGRDAQALARARDAREALRALPKGRAGHN
jgi:N-acetylglucosaminyl-diphospho-decaprenol L-rhamnosyltransferase